MATSLAHAYEWKDPGDPEGAVHRATLVGGVARDRVADPVTGAVAEAVASPISMPQFPGGRTGTCIRILDPELDGREPGLALERMIEAAPHHAWPRTCRLGDRGPELVMQAALDDAVRSVPTPEEHPWLGQFVWPLKLAAGGRASSDPLAMPRTERMELLRPQGCLGLLGLQKVIGSPTETPSDTVGRPEPPNPARNAKCAPTHSFACFCLCCS